MEIEETHLTDCMEDGSRRNGRPWQGFLVALWKYGTEE